MIQSQNNQEQSKVYELTLQRLIRSNPFNQQFCQKKIKQIKKNSFRKNLIFKQYFNILPNFNTTKKTTSFYPEAMIYDRNKLIKQKQIMFARGLTDNVVPQQLLEELLQQNKKEKGFIKNIRKKSIIIQDYLVYVKRWAIHKISLKQMNFSRQFNCQGLKLCQFQGDQILSIKPYKNSKIEGNNILIRLSRMLIAFNIQQKKIIFQTNSETQFIQMLQTNYSNQIQVLQYANNQTKYSCIQNQKWQCKNTFPEFVHSFIDIGKAQRIFSSYQKLVLKDTRKLKVQTLFQVQNITNQRIYNFTHLKGVSSYSPYLAAAQTQKINFFDIRKMSYPIKSYYHMSQISPNFYLQYCDETTQQSHKCQQQIRPFLLCYSFYQMGSSLIINIDKSDLNQSLQQDKFKHFRMLFQNSKTQIESMSYTIDKDANQIQLFKIDKMGGIQNCKLKFDSQLNRYRRTSIDTKNTFIQAVGSQSQLSKTNYQLDWIQNCFTDKYLASEQINYTIQQKDNQKQQFSGKQQNKKINYANLQNFHHQIWKNAQTNEDTSQQRDLIFPNSLNSTLGTFNQIYPSDDNQTQINPISLLKQNLINYKLFFDLKNQWEN